MRYQRFLPWLRSFSIEWIAPKFGIAFAVSTVSAILFSMDPTMVIPEPAQKKLDGIFYVTLSPFYEPALLLIGVIYIAGLATRQRLKGKNRKTFFYLLDRCLPFFSKVLDFTIGLLLVPMVISISALHYLPGDHHRQLQVFAITSVFFIIFGGVFHFLGGYQAPPRHSITYIISPPDKNIDADLYRYKTHERLEEIISHVPWHSDPELTTETFDHQIVLVIPIFLHISAWSLKEKKDLGLFLSAVELEWKQANYKFQRIDSMELAGYHTEVAS